MAEPTTHSTQRVLIVDDDPATRTGLTELVRAWGFTAESAGDGAEALERVTDFRPSIIVSDMVMPRMSGLDLLKALAGESEHIKVILLTALGTVDTAVEALKAGAEDYLTKPLDPHKLQRLLERLAELNEQKRENQVLRRQLTGSGRFGRIIGHSAAMRALYQVLEQAAPTPASMLLLGESGTGKELVAQTIHQLSPRAAAPFIALNCAAIPDTLLESEVFGHEKGAFTGATDRRLGCFELADRGTLFLDEIAEMTPAAMRLLENYDWPGNVRELRNVIERATILARADVIEPPHLPTLGAAAVAVAPANGLTIAPGMTVDEAEQKLIVATLDAANGNKTRAAEMLGISLKTLHNKLNRFKEDDAKGS